MPYQLGNKANLNSPLCTHYHLEGTIKNYRQ
jgi:hypothetical protein